MMWNDGTQRNLYGYIEIPHRGTDYRNEDALECLLALCRTLGLEYRIEHSKVPGSDQYAVGLRWEDWPTDFYAPCKRYGEVWTVCVDYENIVSVLSSTIEMAIDRLRDNGQQFGMHFKRDWLSKYGVEWGNRGGKQESETGARE